MIHGSCPGLFEPGRAIALDTAFSSRNVRAFNCAAQARSSVEEHYLDTVGVGGSIPPVPTTTLRPGRAIRFALASVRAGSGTPAPIAGIVAEMGRAPQMPSARMRAFETAPRALGEGVGFVRVSVVI